MSSLPPQSGAVVAKHTALLALGLALGAWYGNPFAGLAAAALLALGWHLTQLRRLLQWSSTSNNKSVLSGGPGSGPWAALYSNVHHMRAVNQRLKNRQRELLQQWRDVTNALPDAGLLLDADYQIVQYNDTARRTLGLIDSEAIGLRITNILRNPNVVEMFDQQHFGEPERIAVSGDSPRVYSCRVTRYGADQFLLIIRDITQRERADRVKADFVANASHELSTPLTVLHGYLMSMSEDAQVPDLWHEPVHEMITQIQRMQDLVADLMHLNELEVQTDAPRTPVAVGDILEQACKDTRRMVNGQTDVNLTRNDAYLLGDASAIRSVVTNLLSNAARFTPPGGRIDVEWWHDEDGGHISVRDTGVGIAPDDIERVTERFYRGDPGRARHHGGTGLGLAIVKHALSMHQAQLAVHSDGKSGSTFVCHFPVARVTAAMNR